MRFELKNTTVLPIATLTAALIMFSGSLKAQSGSLAGTLKNAAGAPVAGALVKVNGESNGLGFMVVSQNGGRYSIPNLPAGKYVVQAFGGLNQSVLSAPTEITGARPVNVDLVLSARLETPPTVKRLTDAEFEKLLPDSEIPGVKNSLVHQCRDCHSLERIASARKTPEQWRATIDRKRDYEIEDRRPLWLRFDEDELLDRLWYEYLAKNLGPDTPQYPDVVKQWRLQPGSPSHPNRNLPSTLLTGAAAKYFAVEYSVPAGAAPREIAVDSQGTAWVGERDKGVLGRFDPQTLTYTRISLPPAESTQIRVHAVSVDPQDQIWLVDDGPNARILQYNPRNGAFNSYPIPAYRWPVPDEGWARIATLTFLDGNVWAAAETSDRILMLKPGSRQFVDYPVPRGTSPYGLAVGPNKTVWYSGLIGNSIVRLDPANGRLTPYKLTTERSELKALAADSQLNLWAAATDSGKLIRVGSQAGDVVELSPPTQDSGPFALDVDTKHDFVWFSEIFTDRIARYDPKTKTFVEYPHPDADSDVRKIQVDPSRPNRVWWASPRNNKIGYIETLE